MKVLNLGPHGTYKALKKLFVLKKESNPPEDKINQWLYQTM